MTRLTKDQRREQKKLKERKQSLHRSHEKNRENNQLSSAMDYIRKAIAGEQSNRHDLEEALLELFRDRKMFDLPDPFESELWKFVRRRVSQIVRNIYNSEFNTTTGNRLALTGRAYYIPEGEETYFVEYMPLTAIMASGWDIPQVLQELSKEIHDDLTPGVYVTGVTFGKSTFHIAQTCTAKFPKRSQFFLINENGWHRLDPILSDKALCPLICEAIHTHGHDDAQIQGTFELINLLSFKGQDHGEPVEFTPLNELDRHRIMHIGKNQLQETELMAAATMSHDDEDEGESTFDVAWNEGFNKGKLERDQIWARLQKAEKELLELRSEETGLMPVRQVERKLALGERMGAMLQPVA